MRIGIVALMAAIIAPRLPAQTGDGHLLTVHVVNRVTGAPIAGAKVVVSTVSGDVTWGRSDPGGMFSRRILSQGQHLLTVTRKGYSMTGGGGLGTTVDIPVNGEIETTVRMVQLGVVAGRVLDQFGDPVRNALVRTLDREHSGQEEYFESFSTATTDDRGEYRIVNVEPGRHYLAAEYDSQHIDLYSGSRPRFRWPDLGGYVLFPNTTDIAQAQHLEVISGQTTRVDDMVLPMRHSVTIRGHVKPLPNEKSVGLDVHLAGPHLGLNVFGGKGLSCDADGSFKVEVLPGRYVLSASDQKTGKLSREATIEVGDKNVADVELTLSLSYEINGRISINGQEHLDFSKLILNFMGEPVKIGADGSFRSNAFRSRARYTLQGLPEDWYVERVLVAGREISGTTLSLEPGTTDLSITVSPRGATVYAKPDGAGTGFEAASVVVLLPENGPPPDIESVLHSMADPAGALVVHGVPPGSYRAIALDLADSLMIMRPDLLMEKYAKAGPLVTVFEGERKTITVPLTKIQVE